MVMIKTISNNVYPNLKAEALDYFLKETKEKYQIIKQSIEA